MSGRSGLLVIGGDLCSEGHRFESQYHIIDENFLHMFVVQKCNACLKKTRDTGSSPILGIWEPT